MPIRNLVILLLSGLLSAQCYLQANNSKYAATIAEAMQLVRVHYLQEVDSRALFENAMKGMISELDQYSGYIGPDHFERMEESLDQEFGGVGIEIDKPTVEGPLIVLSPLLNTPAFEAGLKSGDQILAVDGAITLGVEQNDAVEKMRGRPGSAVELLIQRGDEEPFEVSVTREIIVVESVLGDTRRPDGSWDYHLQRDRRIGLLRITTFGKHTARELSDILAEDGNPPFDALILDIRHNAGGLLDAAVETCDLFVASGRIVSTRGRDQRPRSTFDASSSLAVPLSMPIAVVVNQESASASEIVAACLQDHDRAIVVGERTWGKGTVQNILELEGGRSALKLTTASYWRPSGKNIHRLKDASEDEAWGVQPDEGYLVSLSDEERIDVLRHRRFRDLRTNLPEALQIPEGEDVGAEPVPDPQLDRAIEYLHGELQKADAQTRTAARFG